MEQRVISCYDMKYYIHNENYIGHDWEWFLLGDSKGVYVRYCVHNKHMEDLQTKGYIQDTVWSKSLLENNEVTKDQWEAVLFTRYL